MKCKSLVALLAAAILLSASFLFRWSRERVFHHFPAPPAEKHDAPPAALYLYLFFSKTNCKPCLDVIGVLNRLQYPLIVSGVAPARELEDIKSFREATGAMFPLWPDTKWKRCIPVYAPSIIGVTRRGRVLFLMPATPGLKDRLEDELITIYAASAKPIAE